MPDTSSSSRSSTRQVLASESRLRLLDILSGAGRGMHAGELAAECGLHVSTVRFHLDELLGAGLVETRPEPSRGRGRPRQLFLPVSRAVAAAVPGTGNQTFSGYEHLARVLAASIAAGDDLPAAMVRAESAGRRWAAELMSEPDPPQGGHRAARDDKPHHRKSASPGRDSTASVLAAATKVNGLFAGLGFDPELRPRNGNEHTELLLHACPFEAVVTDHPDVVCSLHLGLLEGALDRLAPEGIRAQLDGPIPWRPCVARMSPPDSQ